MDSYLVWQPEAGQTEEDAREVLALAAQFAAEAWAKTDDHVGNEYTIVGGQPATVMVRDLRGGEATEWIVSGELVRRYTANAKRHFLGGA